MAGRCGVLAVTPCRFYPRPKIACHKIFSEKFPFSYIHIKLYWTASNRITRYRTVSTLWIN